VRSMLIERGVSKVLVVALADLPTRTKYTPPSYDPIPYYGTFHGYYSHYWIRRPLPTRPGSVQREKVFALEANLYDLTVKEGSGLVWNARTTTVDPESVSDFAEEYSKTIVAELLSARSR